MVIESSCWGRKSNEEEGKGRGKKGRGRKEGRREGERKREEGNARMKRMGREEARENG